MFCSFVLLPLLLLLLPTLMQIGRVARILVDLCRLCSVLWHQSYILVLQEATTIFKSSTEVEYCAVAYTAAEMIWIRKLLHYLCIHLSTPTTVYCDNISASYMTVNPVQHDRNKHIVVHYHFVCEHVT